MSDLVVYCLVALGGALGSVARYAATLAAARAWGAAFPWGTILINVAGSFIIACFGTLTARSGLFPAGPGARIFVMVGMCGGFTTFSSFSLQTLELAQDGSWFGAAANILLSVIVCLAAAAAGYHLAVWLGSSPRSEP
jgi:CrcB protein